MTTFNALNKLNRLNIPVKRDYYDSIIFAIPYNRVARGVVQDGRVIYWAIEDLANPDQPQFDNFTTVYEKSLKKGLQMRE